MDAHLTQVRGAITALVYSTDDVARLVGVEAEFVEG